ncbi:MAG: A24 family peptidase [Lachnospiraceae bacterium]|nr:A24 family peptidase [Lachnospiraceae bacterium]
MYQYGLTGAVLLVCTYTDIRYRKIYKCLIMGHLVLALILHIMIRDSSFISVLAGIIPGLICLLLSALTRQALGYGDAMLILSCGFSLGGESCLAALLTAFFCVGAWAFILICFRHGKGKTEIPFVPFLLAGVVLQGMGM